MIVKGLPADFSLYAADQAPPHDGVNLYLPPTQLDNFDAALPDTGTSWSFDTAVLDDGHYWIWYDPTGISGIENEVGEIDVLGGVATPDTFDTGAAVLPLLTTLQRRWLRDEIGDGPTDEELQAKYDDLGSVRDVAIAFIRSRITKLTAQPMSVNLNGVAAVNYAENVKALERRLVSLTRLDDDPSDDPGSETGGDVAPTGSFEIIRLARTRGR